MGEAGETPWPRGAHTGGAWLSSARVVRCWVKSRNERNPRRVLPSGDAGNPRGTAAVKAEEGGDDVKSSCPLCPGLHTCYNGRYRGMPPREGERIPESRPQFGLGAATRPHEVGVASNRGSACRGECVPGPCTHRPSHHPSRLHPKSPAQPQGSRTGRCGWITSFLGRHILREINFNSNRGQEPVRQMSPGSPRSTRSPGSHPRTLRAA